MAEFTTRIELQGADSDDYNTLHEEMEATGFSRTIVGTSGTRYNLPNAEYNYVGNVTRNHVFDLASNAAALTGRNSYILVTESAGRTFRLAPAR